MPLGLGPLDPFWSFFLMTLYYFLIIKNINCFVMKIYRIVVYRNNSSYFLIKSNNISMKNDLK